MATIILCVIALAAS